MPLRSAQVVDAAVLGPAQRRGRRCLCRIRRPRRRRPCIGIVTMGGGHPRCRGGGGGVRCHGRWRISRWRQSYRSRAAAELKILAAREPILRRCAWRSRQGQANGGAEEPSRRGVRPAAWSSRAVAWIAGRQRSAEGTGGAAGSEGAGPRHGHRGGRGARREGAERPARCVAVRRRSRGAAGSIPWRQW